MPGPETMTLKKVSIEAVTSGTKLRHDGRWYEWRRVQADDLRHLAYFLSPNAPTGERTNTGHTIADGTEVEVVADYFDDFGEKLDKHPIGVGAVSRGSSLGDALEDFSFAGPSSHKPSRS